MVNTTGRFPNAFTQTKWFKMMLNLRYMVVSNNDLVKIVSTLINQFVYILQRELWVGVVESLWVIIREILHVLRYCVKKSSVKKLIQQIIFNRIGALLGILSTSLLNFHPCSCSPYTNALKSCCKTSTPLFDSSYWSFMSHLLLPLLVSIKYQHKNHDLWYLVLPYK
jgi:hypothetical protein